MDDRSCFVIVMIITEKTSHKKPESFIWRLILIYIN